MKTPFQLGMTLITVGAQRALTEQEIRQAFRRHAEGDWGDVCEDDRQENELALKEGFRLFSVYRSESGLKFWVITEADRSSTTLLLPDEY